MNNRTLPRGLRNCNPLNIVISDANNWVGKVYNNTDGTFEQFQSMEFGYRAAFLLMRTYVQKHGVETIEQLIHKWCPDHTAGHYVKNVCSMTDYAPTSGIYLDSEDFMVKLAYAMTIVENGQSVDEEIIRKGYRKAFPVKPSANVEHV